MPATTTSRVAASTPAWAFYAGSKPPPATGSMMRDSSSVRLIWSLSRAPGAGAFGSFPPNFLPAASSLATRRAILSSYSAFSL